MPILSRVRRYVPTQGGNDKLPDGEQIVVFLKNVDVTTRQNHIRKFINTPPEQIVALMMEDKGSKEIQQILFNNVVRVENLIFEDNADGVAVTNRPATIKDIWEQGEFGLCLELFTNILNASQLTKDEVKNSESQSGSTPMRPELVENVH